MKPIPHYEYTPEELRRLWEGEQSSYRQRRAVILAELDEEFRKQDAVIDSPRRGPCPLTTALTFGKKGLSK